MGMIYATRIAMEMNLADDTVLKRQESLLKKLGLSLKDNELNPNDIVRVLYQDKKTIGGKLRFVLPTRIGDVAITDELSDEIILKVLSN
jgi:3-dehydroquinate synthase